MTAVVAPTNGIVLRAIEVIIPIAVSEDANVVGIALAIRIVGTAKIVLIEEAVGAGGGMGRLGTHHGLDALPRVTGEGQGVRRLLGRHRFQHIEHDREHLPRVRTAAERTHRPAA